MLKTDYLQKGPCMDNDVIEKRQKMKNTVFFGNGFNRSKNGMFSWEDLLNELASPEKGFSNEFPNTMHYEYAVMKKLNNVIDLLYTSDAADEEDSVDLG